MAAPNIALLKALKVPRFRRSIKSQPIQGIAHSQNVEAGVMAGLGERALLIDFCAGAQCLLKRPMVLLDGFTWCSAAGSRSTRANRRCGCCRRPCPHA